MTFFQRLLVIIQLCLSFSIVLWIGFQPFLGEYFSVKSRLILYEYVIGTSSHFSQLPKEQQKEISKDYKNLSEFSSRSIWVKLKEGLKAFLIDTPAFGLAWIVFSITISILLLLKVEGASQAAWLLPLIALSFTFDNYQYGFPAISSPDETLFPSEEIIVQKPLSSSINEQRNQLQEGWNSYLIENWSLKNPNEGKEKQLEEGEFYFTLARIKLLSSFPLPSSFILFHQKRNAFFLLLFILWNLLFALYSKKQQSSIIY